MSGSGLQEKEVVIEAVPPCGTITRSRERVTLEERTIRYTRTRKRRARAAAKSTSENEAR
jgi:hypothetical protein